MKKILALCLLAAPSILAAGCGEITAVNADRDDEERFYVTGSNIAHRTKDGDMGIDTTIVGPEGVERQLNHRGQMPPKGLPAG